jgi:hypothetical protein
MATTAVERFTGVNQDKLMTPPVDAPSPKAFYDIVSFEIRHRVRRLAGF